MRGYMYRHFEKKGRHETRLIEGKDADAIDTYSHTRTGKNWTVAGDPVWI
jgi:hypothetical protein